jgi:hypothetical protein
MQAGELQGVGELHVVSNRSTSMDIPTPEFPLVVTDVAHIHATS